MNRSCGEEIAADDAQDLWEAQKPDNMISTRMEHLYSQTCFSVSKHHG
jgi:hypothetical protein